MKDKAYWEEIFTTIPEVASLVPMQEDKKDISCEGARKKFTFSSNDLANIKVFCDSHKISFYNFFAAIYSLYIAKISSLTNIFIGIPI